MPGKKRAMFDPASDPYAYLEDSSAPATIAWTLERNRATRSALDAIPGRARLEARFEELTRIDSQGVPVVRGGRAFYSARRGEADQTSLYVRDAAGERVLLEPAALDPSGLTALDWWYPSPLGRYVAFGLSRGGDERSHLHVLDVATLERLAEAIPDTRHCSLAWLPGESGFYYTRYPPGGDYDMRVYRHMLGAPWENEAALFGEGRKAEEWTVIDLSENGAWLVATVYDGWARSDVYAARASEQPPSFRPVAVGRDAIYDPVAGNGALYLRTNDGAPRYRVYQIDYERLECDGWREIVSEEAGSLDAMALAGTALILHYYVAARSELRVRYPGGRSTNVDLGGRSVLALSASEADPVAYVSSSSFLEPPVTTKVSVGGDATSVEPWFEVAVPFARDYEVEQVWYASADGTAIPMTIVSRRGVARDGTAPAVLYGYGGFNVSLVPWFVSSIVPWLDSGGVYAVANLRGGGEFGDAWHRAGMRERKQNVFDDFIAAAEYLGTSGRADPGRIALWGGSNGGLLVAAVAVQRPALARAVLCLVPLTDMLRFHHFSIARLWIAEYGDPDVPGDAAFLREYSPYHNVRDGVAYPAMLVATAEADGRVDPMHARKFGARLASATGGNAPILVYVEPNAGHGAGKPRHKRVAELADHWAFVGWQLGQVLG